MERRVFLNQFTVMATPTSKIIFNSSKTTCECIKDYLRGTEAKSHVFKVLPRT